MAEEKENLEMLLSAAKESEREYNWAEAAAMYSKLESRLSESDLLEIGKIRESLAYASYRESFQSDSIQEFRTRLDKASEKYQRARDSCEASNDPKAKPYVARCQAMLEFIKFWKSEKGTDKRNAIGEVWRLAQESMAAFESQSEALEFILTWNNTWRSAGYNSHLADDSDGISKPILDITNFGERAIQCLAEDGNETYLAATHTIVGLHQEFLAMIFSDLGNQSKDFHQRAATHWRKAMELSRESSIIELSSTGGNNIPFDLGADELMGLLEDALQRLRTTRDRLMIGCALIRIAYQLEWKLSSVEDNDQLYTLAEKVLRYASEANENFTVLSAPSPILSGWWVDPPSELALDLAALESEIAKKRIHAKNALASSAQLRTSEEIGYPLDVTLAKVGQFYALNELAKTENAPESKRKILEESISLGRLCVSDLSRLQPNLSWNRGVTLSLIAESQFQIASLIDDSAERLKVIKSAVLDMKDSVAYVSRGVLAPGDLGFLGSLQHEYGVQLMSLAELNGDSKTLVESSMAFEESARTYQKNDMPSRAAESLWESARCYDRLCEHLGASERFEEASQQYQKAAAKIRRLAQLYQDHHLYMMAWSEIELAKYQHSRQNSASCGEHYRKAAEFHASTKKWSFLASNYYAWAEIERAQDSSQNDISTQSIEAFNRAGGLFKDSEKMMREHLPQIDSPGEKLMVEKLINVSGQRQALCKARIALEEAKLLDKEGNLDLASERYELVAEMFTKIKEGLDHEEDKKDTELMITLSRAWKAMAKAEAESSPELYEVASRLFEDAKNLSAGEKAKALVMGHSRLSMALAAGTKYADTGDSALHKSAVQNLESAAKFYLKADQRTAVEYVKGCKLLFDSYDYMNRASSEPDENKKTKLYVMAEKVLHASASSFERSGQHGRRDQVLKLLSKVKDDRELALSLVDVFLAPDVVSSTMAFSSATQTQETAVGLDRFEHADVHAALIASPTRLQIGQELRLEIELANAGRGTAQLAMIEEIVPEGFVIVEKPEKCRIENSHMNLRGKRLEALKTEDLKLVLKPTVRGNFRISPRVVYLDESGRPKSFQMSTVEVAVREIGIAGWIKGT